MFCLARLVCHLFREGFSLNLCFPSLLSTLPWFSRLWGANVVLWLLLAGRVTASVTKHHCAGFWVSHMNHWAGAAVLHHRKLCLLSSGGFHIRSEVRFCSKQNKTLPCSREQFLLDGCGETRCALGLAIYCRQWLCDTSESSHCRLCAVLVQKA